MSNLAFEFIVLALSPYASHWPWIMAFMKGNYTGQDINFEFGALGCLRHCSAGKAVEISGEKAARATLLPPGTLSHPLPPLAKTPAHQTF